MESSGLDFQQVRSGIEAEGLRRWCGFPYAKETSAVVGESLTSQVEVDSSS